MTELESVGLFSGVGGAELGMHRAGIKPRALCEIDSAARAVLARRFPGVPIFSDVREVTGDALRDLGLVPHRTIVSAGFPCQDLSVAGRRAGLDHGARSGLFWEIDRILGEFPAVWVLLENVAGLLSATCPCPGDGLCVARSLTVRCPGELHTITGGACGGRGCIAEHGGAMGAVLGALGDRGYGYAYRVLDSQHFGVPQRRRRVFIVGRRAGGPGWAAPARVLLEPEGSRRDPAAREPAGPDVASWPDGGVAGARGQRIAPPVTSKWAKGTGGPAGDETQNLVLSVPRVAATLNSGGDDGGFRTEPGEHLVMVRQGETSRRGLDIPGDMGRGGVSPTLNAGENHSDVRATVLAVMGRVTHTLTSDGSDGSDGSEDGTGRGTPIIAFSHSAGLDLTPSEAVTPPVMSGHDRMPSDAGHAVVRRLTPLECERLQGFPDGWTDGQCDSARYRQIGNAETVDVVEWIAHRIVAVENSSRSQEGHPQ